MEPNVEPSNDGELGVGCQTNAVIAAVVAAHVVWGLVIAVMIVVDLPNQDWMGGIILGTWFSQAGLLAVWLALSPQPFATRFPIVASFTALVCLETMTLARESPSILSALVFGVLFLLQWGLVQAPLWFVRIKLGWQLVHRADEHRYRPSASADIQFGIRQLFVWTAGIALLLGAGRLLIPQELSDSDFLELRLVLAILIIIGIGNILVALPLVWALLVNSMQWVWLAVAVLVCGTVSWLQPWTFNRVVGLGSEAALFFFMNSFHIVLVAVTLTTVRACGFRLCAVRAAGDSSS